MTLQVQNLSYFILFFPLVWIRVKMGVRFRKIGRINVHCTHKANIFNVSLFQADTCHAYQILHKNGIPDENIVVMMYDDIANNDQ